MKKITSIILTVVMCICMCIPLAIEGSSLKAEAATIKLKGMAHVQNYGDVQGRTEMIGGIPTLILGTRGQSKRLERININFENNTGYKGKIQYQVYCQTYGWFPWTWGGQNAGTMGESKRLEGIKIRLTGELALHYTIRYQTHIQGYGDNQGWVYNGALAGTTGESKRLEEIRIQIMPKTEIKNTTPSVSYRVHRQTYGWESTWARNGQVSGTTGKSKRLEGIEIRLEDTSHSGDVIYKTHIQTYGWEDVWRADGDMSGTQGQSKRLEAIQIKLRGDIAKYYDIYYRVHSQNFGWMGWAKNGEEAGTEGYAYRLEAIQIRLVSKKDGKPPLNDGNTKSRFEKKRHTHDYKQEYKTIHHDAVYEEKTVPVEVMEQHVYCGECGEDLTYKDTTEHKKATKYTTIINGKKWTFYACSTTYTKYIMVTHYEKQKVLVKEAYDEKIPTGRWVCACGAVK